MNKKKEKKSAITNITKENIAQTAQIKNSISIIDELDNEEEQNQGSFSVNEKILNIEKLATEINNFTSIEKFKKTAKPSSSENENLTDKEITDIDVGDKIPGQKESEYSQNAEKIKQTSEPDISNIFTIEIPDELLEKLPNSFNIDELGKVDLKEAELIAKEDILSVAKRDLLEEFDELDLISDQDNEVQPTENNIDTNKIALKKKTESRQNVKEEKIEQKKTDTESKTVEETQEAAKATVEKKTKLKEKPKNETKKVNKDDQIGLEKKKKESLLKSNPIPEQSQLTQKKLNDETIQEELCNNANATIDQLEKIEDVDAPVSFDMKMEDTKHGNEAEVTINNDLKSNKIQEEDSALNQDTISEPIISHKDDKKKVEKIAKPYRIKKETSNNEIIETEQKKSIHINDNINNDFRIETDISESTETSIEQLETKDKIVKDKNNNFGYGKKNDNKKSKKLKKEVNMSKQSKNEKELPQHMKFFDSENVNVHIINDEGVEKKINIDSTGSETDELEKITSGVIDVIEGKAKQLVEADKDDLDGTAEPIRDNHPTFKDLLSDFRDKHIYIDDEVDFIDNSFLSNEHIQYKSTNQENLDEVKEQIITTQDELLGLRSDELEIIENQLFEINLEKINSDSQIIHGLDQHPVDTILLDNYNYILPKPDSLLENERKSIEEDISASSALIFEEDVKKIKSKLEDSMKKEIEETIQDITDLITIFDDNSNLEKIIDKISEGNKKDVKKLLKYLNNLFDKLPEDSIKKFADSEYYKLYEKVLKDMDK